MEIGGKYKLIMIRTKYLKNSLKISKDILQKAYVDFMSQLNHEVNSTKRPSIKEQEKKKAEINEEKELSTEKPLEDQQDIEIKKEQKDDNLKQAFKKIAIAVHPDKLGGLPEFERKYKESLFDKARTALEENDYYAIVEVSEELGIEPPEPTQEQINTMKKMNSTLEKEIQKIEKSLVWTWYHSEDDKKKKLMENYIGYLEKQCAGP
tara:strand:+ start:1028 stop:1648 length:621 start_codon:yes stop_codon:yes gene_type:complete